MQIYAKFSLENHSVADRESPKPVLSWYGVRFNAQTNSRNLWFSYNNVICASVKRCLSQDKSPLRRNGDTSQKLVRPSPVTDSGDVILFNIRSETCNPFWKLYAYFACCKPKLEQSYLLYLKRIVQFFGVFEGDDPRTKCLTNSI